MAVAKRSSSSVAYGSRTNTPVTVPVGAVAGDVITIALAVGNSAQVNPTTPAGWTVVKDAIYTAPDPWSVHLVLYVKAFVPGETSYTIIHPSGSSQAYAVAWSGVDASALLDVAAVSAFQNDNVTSGTNVATAPALTIATAGAQGIIVRGSWDGNAITPPTGWTEDYDTPVLWVGEKPYPATGTTDPVAVSAGNGSSRSPWGIIHAALRPASAGNSYTASGAVRSTSSVAGAVTARVVAVGAVASASAVSGTVTASRPVAGSVASESTVAGSVVKAAPASGTVSTPSAVAGSVTSRLPTTGAVTSSTDVTGGLTASLPASGRVDSSTTVSGDLTVPGGLSGTIATATSIAGRVTSRLPATGRTGSVSTVAGAMEPSGGLSGAIRASSGVTGDVSARYMVAGEVTGSTSVRGRVSAIFAVKGQVASSSSVSGWMRAGDSPAFPDVLTLTGAVEQYTLTGSVPVLTLEVT